MTDTPQKCLCGGEARVLRFYRPENGIVCMESPTGYLVHCDVCAAMTLPHDAQEEAERAWTERRCPLTYNGVAT